MKEKFITFLRANFIIWAFLGITVIIELTGVCVTSGKFFIRRPLMFLSMLGVFSCILFLIKNQRARYWCAFAFMAVFFIVDLVFIVVHEMTGATFDYSMLQLRNDALAIVESIPLDFVYVLVCGICISLYMLLARYYIRKAPKPTRVLPTAAVAVITAAVLGINGGIGWLENRNNDPADLSYKLYADGDGSYSDRGIVGNFLDELYKGAFFNTVPLGDASELNDYVYQTVSTPTEMFGAASGYNVVTVLCESFEWFSFLADMTIGGEKQNAYPGGYGENVSEETLRALFPTLYELYDTSVVCLNHHAREKTDISENQAIIGNYPTGCYINYDYPENTVPYSLPNMLQTVCGVESHSFHDGKYLFYNRATHHQNALGFSSFTASEQMAETEGGGFTPYGLTKGDYNLDSEMMDVCKEEMFPTDRRFNTFITTITMHGQNILRPSLTEKGYYDMLFDAGIAQAYADAEGSLESANSFIHYAAAALDFEKAMRTMMDYLREKNLLDNTVIVLFGDHNAYYGKLGDDVKQIYADETSERNYTDLFRVPMMIHIGAQTERREITKFTTTTDIVPTLLDLLGIRFYNNLYYGNSVFSDAESMIYSRAYNVFITDKLFFSSLNSIKYRSPDATDAYVDEIAQKAMRLLDKTSHVNRIFYYDFLSGDNAETFYRKTQELNA